MKVAWLWGVVDEDLGIRVEGDECELLIFLAPARSASIEARRG